MASGEDLSFFESAGDPQVDAIGSAAPSAHTQYLVFAVAGMELAVALAYVLEIVPYERVSEVPGTPPLVRGVVHLRGRVIPIVDLAVKLGRTPQLVTKRTCILMLELTIGKVRLPVGIATDGVATLLDVDVAQIKEAPRLGVSIDVRFLEGLVPTERGMLPLVDVQRLFEVEELAVVAASAREGVPEHA